MALVVKTENGAVIKEFEINAVFSRICQAASAEEFLTHSNQFTKEIVPLSSDGQEVILPNLEPGIYGLYYQIIQEIPKDRIEKVRIRNPRESKTLFVVSPQGQINKTVFKEMSIGDWFSMAAEFFPDYHEFLKSKEVYINQYIYWYLYNVSKIIKNRLLFSSTTSYGFTAFPKFLQIPDPFSTKSLNRYSFFDFREDFIPSQMAIEFPITPEDLEDFTEKGRKKASSKKASNPYYREPSFSIDSEFCLSLSEVIRAIEEKQEELECGPMSVPCGFKVNDVGIEVFEENKNCYDFAQLFQCLEDASKKCVEKAATEANKKSEKSGSRHSWPKNGV